MSYTIINDNGVLQVRAGIARKEELRDFIAALKPYEFDAIMQWRDGNDRSDISALRDEFAAGNTPEAKTGTAEGLQGDREQGREAEKNPADL